MKIYTFFFFFTAFFSYAQVAKDTAYLCFTKASYIVFNEPISFFEIGTKDFQIKSNKVASNILSLQSVEPKKDKFLPTNLFVTTEKGTLLYYDIFFCDTLKQYTFFQKKNTINEPVKAIQQTDITDKQKQIDTAFCKFLLNKKDNKKMKSENQGIFFNLLNLYYYEEMFYFKFAYENTSGIDYDISFTKFFRKKDKTGKKNTEQDQEIFPIETYNLPVALAPGEKCQVLFIFDKFTLENNEFLSVECKEKTGERFVSIKLPFYYIAYGEKVKNYK